MNELPNFDIDYCKYGMPFKKKTGLWCSPDKWTAQQFCQKDCNSNSSKVEEWLEGKLELR